MKYDLLVGDYVETKDGRVGYITQVAFTNEVKRWCFIRIMRRQNDFIIAFEGPEDLIPEKFNRIGKYDFTKKKECKIEPLVKSHLLETADGEDECYFDSREVIEKINELVDAVNRLEEKVIGMAQS